MFSARIPPKWGNLIPSSSSGLPWQLGPQHRPSRPCRAEPNTPLVDTTAIMGRLGDRNYLDAAAKRFTLGIENGLSEDEMVALEFKGNSLEDTYREKIKRKLIERSAKLKEEEEERIQRLAKSYLLGKEAYE